MRHFQIISIFILLLLGSKATSYANIDSLRYELITADDQKEKENLVNLYLSEIDNYKLDSIITYSKELLEISKKTNNHFGIVKAKYFIGLHYGYQLRYTEALKWNHSGIQHAIRHKDTTHIVTGYRLIAQVHSRTNQADSLRYYSRKAIQLAKSINNYVEEGAAYIDLASFYNMQSNPDSALYYYQRSIDLFEQGNNAEAKAVSLGNIGNLLNESESYEIAKSHLFQAIKINETYNYLFELSNNYNNLGIAYEKLGQLDSAEYAFQKSIEINNKLGDIKSNAITYNNLGSLYILQEDLANAQKYFERSFRICDSMNIEIGKYYFYHGMSDVYFKQNQYNQSIDYLFKSIEIADKNGGPKLKIKPIHSLYKVFKATGDNENALKYLEEYNALSDSINLISREKQIDQYKVLYDTKHKENELLKQKIKFENKSKEVELSRIKSQRRLNILLTLVALFIIMFIGYVRLRIKTTKIKKQSEIIRKNHNLLKENADEIQKQSQKLKEQNLELSELTVFKENIISTMVHDLKTPLNAIIGLSSLEPDEEMQSHIHYSGKNMMNLVSNILDVQRYEQVGLQTKIKTIYLDKILHLAIKDVDLDLLMRKQKINKVLAAETVFADQDLLRRVFVNILSNAIKYSPKASEITITANQIKEKDKVIIRIKDHGSGIEKSHIEQLFKHYSNFNPKAMGMSYSTGIGLSFCKIAIEAMQGEIGILSEEGNGTEVWFTLPC